MSHFFNLDWFHRDGMPVRVVSGTAPGPFHCRIQAVGPDGVPVDHPGIPDALKAFDLNGAEHPADEVVWVKVSQIPDAEGRCIYLISSGSGAAETAGEYRGQVHSTAPDGTGIWEHVQFTPGIP
jgi:hypothetical protein